MKKINIPQFAIVLLSILLLSFIYESNKSGANAEQREGIYIFILSKPVTAYDTQGSIKKSFALSGDPGEMLNALIKKCKKEYPGADGLIFTSLSMDKADCIKFK